MKLLEDRIRRDGIVKEGNVLKVDSFLESSDGCGIIWSDGRRMEASVCRSEYYKDSDD